MPAVKRTSLAAQLKERGNSAAVARLELGPRSSLVAIARRWGHAFWVFEGLDVNVPLWQVQIGGGQARAFGYKIMVFHTECRNTARGEAPSHLSLTVLFGVLSVSPRTRVSEDTLSKALRVYLELVGMVPAVGIGEAAIEQWCDKMAFGTKKLVCRFKKLWSETPTAAKSKALDALKKRLNDGIASEASLGSSASSALSLGGGDSASFLESDAFEWGKLEAALLQAEQDNVMDVLKNMESVEPFPTAKAFGQLRRDFIAALKKELPCIGGQVANEQWMLSNVRQYSKAFADHLALLFHEAFTNAEWQACLDEVVAYLLRSDSWEGLASLLTGVPWLLSILPNPEAAKVAGDFGDWAAAPVSTDAASLADAFQKGKTPLPKHFDLDETMGEDLGLGHTELDGQPLGDHEIPEAMREEFVESGEVPDGEKEEEKEDERDDFPSREGQDGSPGRVKQTAQMVAGDPRHAIASQVGFVEPEKMNSLTHPREWRRLQRACEGPKTTSCPIMRKMWLAQGEERNKLFRQWIFGKENVEHIESTLKMHVSQKHSEKEEEQLLTIINARKHGISECFVGNNCVRGRLRRAEVRAFVNEIKKCMEFAQWPFLLPDELVGGLLRNDYRRVLGESPSEFWKNLNHPCAADARCNVQDIAVMLYGDEGTFLNETWMRTLRLPLNYWCWMDEDWVRRQMNGSLADLQSKANVRLQIGGPPQTGPADPDGVGLVEWRVALYVAGRSPQAALDFIQLVLDHKVEKGLLTARPRMCIQMLSDLPDDIEIAAPWCTLAASEEPGASCAPFAALPPKGRRHIIAQLDLDNEDDDEDTDNQKYLLSFFGGIYSFRERFDDRAIEGTTLPTMSGGQSEYIRYINITNDEASRERILEVLEGVLKGLPVYFVNLAGEDDELAVWLQEQAAVFPAGQR
ncbi:Uncharacterized protein SCF082_LOCUS37032 [Durusdinium trenchii]|uniref:Uncharacterized protein n=2 Tax=Durusdinium trenchii TaxID=1381693 RepID=A0ABP0PLV7_9DINO